MRLQSIAAVAIALALPAVATAQWMDDFESYANGTVLDNVGGWAGWDNSSAAAGTAVNTQAFGGENSIQVGGNAGGDAVYPVSGYTSGQWTITAQSYIPGGQSTNTYFIVNNQYNHGGPYKWAIQMTFDTGGNVTDAMRGGTLPTAFDVWAEIRIDVDLDANTQTTYYNGSMLSTGSWTTGLGDPVEIANIDLFTEGTVTFYDNVGIIPAPAGGILMLLGAAGVARRRRA